MLKSFTEKFYQGLTGRKPGALVLAASARDEILYKAKRVRSKDYVFHFDFPINFKEMYKEDYVTTTARWKFLLTGAAVRVNCFAPNMLGLDEEIKVGINFESSASLSPFRSGDPQDLNAVLSSLVFGREQVNVLFSGTKTDRFEEYKNLYYLLDQRVNIKCFVRETYYWQLTKVDVILTGLEIFEGGDDE